MKIQNKKILTKCEESETPLETLEDKETHTLFQNKKEITDYRLFINEFSVLAHEFDKNLNVLMQASPDDELEVVISSPGGYTHDLMRLENIFKEYFYNRVTTKLNPYGHSCGAFIFLMGDERIIYENSEIMFHNVLMWSGGKRSDLEEYVTHSKNYWDNYFTKMLLPYFKKTEIKALLKGKEIWLNAYEMCKRGIATKIFIFGNYMDSKDYVKYIENKEFKDELHTGLKKNIDFLNGPDADYILKETETE